MCFTNIEKIEMVKQPIYIDSNKKGIFPLVSFQNIYALPQWVTYLIPHYIAFAKQIINK